MPRKSSFSSSSSPMKRWEGKSRSMVAKWGTNSKGQSRDAVLSAWRQSAQRVERVARRRELERYQRAQAAARVERRAQALARVQASRSRQRVSSSSFVNRDALLSSISKMERSAARKMDRMATGRYKEPKRSPLAGLGYKTADIRQTSLNPLRAGNKQYWSMKQLSEYSASLRKFNSQSTVYYQGHSGGIVSRKQVMNAHKATRKYNKRVRDYKESVRDTPVPWIGEHMTAGEWDDMQRHSPSTMEDASYYNLQERKMPTPKRWRSDEDVERWTESLNYEGSEEAAQDRIDAMYEQIGSMLARVGDPELTNRVAQINDDTLWFLWTNDSTFADSLSHKYEAQRAIDEGDNTSISWAHMQAANSANTHLREIFDALQEIKVPSGSAGLGG